MGGREKYKAVWIGIVLVRRDLERFLLREFVLEEGVAVAEGRFSFGSFLVGGLGCVRHFLPYFLRYLFLFRLTVIFLTSGSSPSIVFFFLFSVFFPVNELSFSEPEMATDSLRVVWLPIV